MKVCKDVYKDIHTVLHIIVKNGKYLIGEWENLWYGQLYNEMLPSS